MPPENFRQELKAADFDRCRFLASHALNVDQLSSLATRLKRLAADPATAKCGLSEVTIALLSNATTKHLTPSIEATGFRYNLLSRVIDTEFGQPVQQAITSSTPVHDADVVVLFLDHRGIPGLREEFEEDEAQAIDQALAYVSEIRDGLEANGSGKIVFATVANPNFSLFGNADARIQGTQSRRIRGFNLELGRQVAAWGHLVFDVAALADAIGSDAWFDDVQWHHAKLPFSLAYAHIFADFLLRAVAASLGRLRKCLILDLDNTVWGGVVGDDGMDGLILGQGSAEGEAYIAVQRMALALNRRGVILAVCSKNNEETVRQVFRSHPDMLLKEEHVAVFMANWRDKASNLEEIAQRLNIGLDSLVLLDDNPAERFQVRSAHPMVGVPELPEDPALYPFYLLAGGYFEAVDFSDNDAVRAVQYRENAEREAAAPKFASIDDYLLAFEMVISFAKFDAVGRSRIAQLVARSNQFNLTTRRFSEAEIAEFEADPSVFTLQIRLQDRFGDNGMISVIICQKREAEWVIVTWLMSCRVLKRRVEEAVLDEIVKAARADGATRLTGIYIPTDKNSLVKDHYAQLGFTRAGGTEDAQEWRLDIDRYVDKHPPMLETLRLF